MAESEVCSNGVTLTEENDELAMYKKDAVSVVSFKMVYNEDFKLENHGVFKPDMAHQIFGESESIFGYRSLAINIYYLHNSSHCYVHVQSSSKVRNSELYQADDIIKCLEPWMPDNFVTDESEFLTLLNNETHDLMFGTVLDEFKAQQKAKIFSGQNYYADYKITLCDLNDNDFKEFHKRFETLIIWFIDAANFIDLEDERWMIFYVYEEVVDSTTKKIYRSPIGYCTVYKFFSYPNKIRARISQFFVLPTHQRRGIGTKLYEAVVGKIKNMPEVIDITVEEPTATFQKIRDFDDCVHVYKALQSENINVGSCSQKQMLKFMKKHKICRRQANRIFDILNCYSANKVNFSAYTKCIEGIKSRIASEIERDNRGSKRLCNLERAGIVMEPVDKKAAVEAEYKKYIDDIERSVKYLEANMKIPV